MRSLVLCGLLALLVACSTSGRPYEPTGGSAPRPVALAVSPHEPDEPMKLPSYIRFTDLQYALTKPFKFRFRGTPHVVTVPSGFVTDFASIPAPFKPIFSRDPHDLPAVIHDYLYWRQSCKRDQADTLFRIGLRDMGISGLKADAMYRAVRIAGGSAWKANENDRAAGLPRVIPDAYLNVPVTTWKKYRAELRRLQVALDPPDAEPPQYCSLSM
ncbi:MAG TPA: DUF1353 domain-containing protein [Longimicrobium sp.]|jgi:hypothetical protein